MGIAPIRPLPPAVADAIAAGEVVERPAAVVKELCENALDAGANRIDVDLEGAGLVRIAVSDDGTGIPADQLVLAVARHATSKVASVGDLAAIRTLGFRGEALASIAAVSELRVLSREAAAETAAMLRVRGGDLVEARPAPRNVGTTVEVCDLFHNTPARLAFLRAARSETAAAVRTIADLSLCRADVAFSCRSDDRLSLRTPGGSLDDALRAIHGHAAAELRIVAGDGEIQVGGRISEPRSHRATRAHLVIVVNGRRIHNRALVAAVEEAYSGLLPTGRHPFGIVDVTLDPAMVDVNVHPTKREVRFREERRVFAAVQRACWEALQGARLSTPASWLRAPAAVAADQPGLALAEGPGDRWTGTSTSALWPSSTTTSHSDVENRLSDLEPLRPLAQAGGGWLVAESPRGLVLVDPHAAHEKVLYAELLDEARAASREGRPPASQLLLIDAVVEVEAAAVEGLIDSGDAVATLGFKVEPFGPGLVRCSAVPAIAAAADCGRLVHELLDSLGGDDSGGQRLRRIAALTACHAAVRLGDRLDGREQSRLLERLVSTPGGSTCPHGRPTVMVLDDPTLRRAFGRPPS